jgi:hypothetical protein
VAIIVTFHFLSGEEIPADMLSKHCGYTQIQERLKALLFWKGDTADNKEVEAAYQAKGECRILSLIFPNKCFWKCYMHQGNVMCHVRFLVRRQRGVFPNAISTAINRTERPPCL